MLSSWQRSFSIYHTKDIIFDLDQSITGPLGIDPDFSSESWASERKSSKCLDFSARYNDIQFNDRDLERRNGCCLHLRFACHCRGETMAEVCERAESALFHSLLHVSPCIFLSVRARLVRYLRDRSSGNYPFQAHTTSRQREISRTR